MGDPTLNSPETITIEVVLTLTVGTDIFDEGALYDEFATALATDLHNILDDSFAGPLRTLTTAETASRGRLL
ncbi:hypothetical protein D3C83_159630 [compost metagenome]